MDKNIWYEVWEPALNEVETIWVRCDCGPVTLTEAREQASQLRNLGVAYQIRLIAVIEETEGE